MLSKLTTNIWEEPFTTLGLQMEHAEVYLALLTKGPTGASNIARIAKLPRSTVYLLLSELSEVGLVTEVAGGKKKIFKPSSPERIKDLLEEKAKQVRRVDLDLRMNFAVMETLYENQRSSFPRVGFFEGVQGIKTVYNDMLFSKELFIQSFGERFGAGEGFSEYFKEFIAEAEERGMIIREILGGISESGASFSSSKSPNHEIRINKGLTKSIDCLDKYVYADKVVYISHDRIKATVIEDSDLSAAEKSTLKYVWENLKG